jgi:hypothetical protein
VYSWQKYICTSITGKKKRRKIKHSKIFVMRPVHTARPGKSPACGDIGSLPSHPLPRETENARHGFARGIFFAFGVSCANNKDNI